MKEPIIADVRVNERGILDLNGKFIRRINTTWGWYVLYGRPYTTTIQACGGM